MKKKILAILFIICLITSVSPAQEFIREMPDQDFSKMLSPEKFPDRDAIIIIKEQSYQITNKSTFTQGVDFFGLAGVYSKILIVKLLNERAVDRYGKFEYYYFERFYDFEAGFDVRARVMKPDGTIWVMPEDDIIKEPDVENSRGQVLFTKVIFKIPDLKPGDLLQIEYAHEDPFTYSTSRKFYHNEEDFILFSNLYLTFPSDKKYIIQSWPQALIGDPKKQQLSQDFGSGQTLFWGIKNVPGLPEEPFSKPYMDLAYTTTYRIVNDEFLEKGGWNIMAENYFENFMDDDDVDDDMMLMLGLPEDAETIKPTWENVNKTFTAIKKYFHTAKGYNLFPSSERLDDLFEEKKGDATDLAYIFYQIMKEMNVRADPVWIRDKENGAYKHEIPSTMWFNRLGILVTIDGKENLYDFHRCLPNQYFHPWFHASLPVILVKEESAEKKVIFGEVDMKDHCQMEQHNIVFDDDLIITDSLCLTYRGTEAESFRNTFYSAESDEITDYFKDELETYFEDNCKVSYSKFFKDSIDIKVNCVGLSKFRTDAVDSFMTFNADQYLINNLKDVLFATKRYNDILFDTPFIYHISWDIQIPDGYELHELPKAEEFKIKDKISSSVSWKEEGNIIREEAIIEIPNRFIPVNDHPKFLDILNKIQKSTAQEIIFKKN